MCNALGLCFSICYLRIQRLMQACLIIAHFKACCCLVFIAAFVITQCWNHSPNGDGGKLGLTLQVAGDVILNLIMARWAEKQGPIDQRKLLEHWQGSVAQCTVDHVPLAGTESGQDKPAGGPTVCG